MSNSSPELVILFEHPDWQEPLFETLTRRGVSFQPLDLKTATLSDRDGPLARLYFNQASPSRLPAGKHRLGTSCVGNDRGPGSPRGAGTERLPCVPTGAE